MTMSNEVAPARRAFNEAKSKALAAWKEAIVRAELDYQEAMAPAVKAYEAAGTKALLTLVI